MDEEENNEDRTVRIGNFHFNMEPTAPVLIPRDRVQRMAAPRGYIIHPDNYIGGGGVDPFNDEVQGPKTPTTCQNCTQPLNRPYAVRQEPNNTKLIWCEHCFKKETIQCAICDSIHTKRSTGISPRVFREQANTPICNRCYEKHTSYVNNRPYQKSVIGSGIGKKVISRRGWGVEIECYLTDARQFAQQVFEKKPLFGIEHDGSLGNVGETMPDGRQYVKEVEIVTPILKGEKGEEYLRDICRMLNTADNAQVDTTCGLHIHLDMTDARKNAEVLKKILILHWVYEPVIMSFLPKTRRSNRYTKSMKNDYPYRKILEATTYTGLQKVWYKNINIGPIRKYSDDYNTLRRYGINFFSLFTHGTLEIRYHSGTTNPTKIMHWANLHTRIVDYCCGLIGTPKTAEELLKMGLTEKGNPRKLRVLTDQLFKELAISESTQKYLKTRQSKFEKTRAMEADFYEKNNLIEN